MENENAHDNQLRELADVEEVNSQPANISDENGNGVANEELPETVGKMVPASKSLLEESYVHVDVDEYG